METRLIKVDPEKLRKYKGFSDDGYSYDRRYSLTAVKKGKRGCGSIPTVLYGPGDVSNAHTVNEYIEMEQVVETVNTLALMIAK